MAVAVVPTLDGSSVTLPSDRTPGERAAKAKVTLVGSKVRCISVTTPAELEALEGRWRTLLSNAALQSPYFSWDFADEWLRHFVRGRVGGATGDFEVVVVVDAAGNDVAIAPFYLERNLGIAAFGHILQPFGRSNSFEPMTDEPIAIFRSGTEVEATAAIREHVLARWGSRCDVATMWVPSGGDKLEKKQVGGAPGALGVTRLGEGPLVVPLARSWPAFLAGLSKSMRDNVSYYPRKLSREIGQWSMSVARKPDEVAEAARALVALHHARSQATTGLKHIDHIPTAHHAAFLHAWFQRAAMRDQIAIMTLKIRGEVVAAQVFLESPGCVSIYYSGFDARYHRYSPLTVITAEMVRMSIERGRGRIEFPPGSKLWKSRWNAREDHKPFEMSFYATRPASLVRGVVRRVYFRLTAAAATGA